MHRGSAQIGIVITLINIGWDTRDIVLLERNIAVAYNFIIEVILLMVILLFIFGCLYVLYEIPLLYVYIKVCIAIIYLRIIFLLMALL